MKKLKLFALAIIALSSAMGWGMEELDSSQLDISGKKIKKQAQGFLEFVMDRNIQYPIQDKEVVEYLNRRVATANNIISGVEDGFKRIFELDLLRINPQEIGPSHIGWIGNQAFRGEPRMIGLFIKIVREKWLTLLSQNIEGKEEGERTAEFLQKKAEERFGADEVRKLLLRQSQKFAGAILERLEPKDNL